LLNVSLDVWTIFNAVDFVVYFHISISYFLILNTKM